MTRKILVIDTETGGLDPEVNAICSLAAVVLHEGSPDGAMHVLINDVEGELEPAALGINGYSRETLQTYGVSPAAAVEALEQFLLFHDMRLPRKVILAGQNTKFDIGFLQRLYLLAGREDYGQTFSRRYLDLMAAGELLYQAGRIDLQDGSASLDSICKAVGVPLRREGGVHNALEDAEATARALSRTIQMIKHTNIPAHPL